MKPTSELQSTAYQAFFSIDQGEYKEKIKFADKYRQVINKLELNEYADIIDAYAEALFETGQFESHIEVANHIAELAIIHNIREVNGKDLYFETLFQKAASLYNLERNSEAIHVLKELLLINPKHESCRLFLINCHVRDQQARQRQTRKASMILILLSAIVISVELLVIRPFFTNLTVAVELARNTIFVAGVLILIVGEIWVRYNAVSRMYDHIHKGHK